MWGPRTELKSYAPDIQTLDFQSPGFDAAATKQVVADWITRYGNRLNAIFLADDSAQAIGTVDALKEAGRTDILVVAAGNSKAGMDLIASGDMLGITYQTAEGDGAAVVKAMGDWFNGQSLPELGYLAQDIITKANVANFQPPQW
jgi:ribose transport system substrate-binding protein